MANNFDMYYAQVLKEEGLSFEDVPGDNGGPTKCGITIADVARWNNVRLPKRDAEGWRELVAKVKALTTETAKPIYKKFYWDSCRADDLPAGLEFAVVDYAVNSGVGRAIPTLGRLVGIPSAKTVTNAVLDAVAKQDLKELINKYQDERRAFLEKIATIPHNTKFRKGWLARETRVRKTSLALLSSPPTVVVAAASLGSSEEASPGVVKTAASSKTVWTLLSGGVMQLINVLTDWVEQAWNGALSIVGVIPAATGEVKEHVDSVEQISTWLKFDPKVAAGVITSVVVVGLVVAIVRHVNDKQALVEAKNAVKT